MLGRVSIKQAKGIGFESETVPPFSARSKALLRMETVILCTFVHKDQRISLFSQNRFF